jgi:tetratricopeptide (TPR) repeat protein
MIPVLILGGAAVAAFFLSGCQDKGEKKAETPSTPSPSSSVSGGPISPPISSSASPSPERKYWTGFGNDLRASSTYLKLLKGGTKESEMDQGCVYPTLGILGRDDGRVESCEVYNYALDNYRKYPDAAEEVTGRPIPWSLDDRNPETSFDENVRAKVDGAIRYLHGLPIFSGLDVDPDPNRKKLATALFYFTDFPDDPELIKRDEEKLKERTKELKAIGLEEFQSYLFKEGGLGVSQFKRDPHGEPHRTALGALEKKEGSDLSKANILYGVFAQAGLLPKFYSVKMKYTPGYPEFEIHPGKIQVFKNIFVATGIGFRNDKSRVFNLHTLESTSRDLEPKVLSLRDYFRLYLYGVGVDGYLRKSEWDKAVSTLELSLFLYPDSDKNQQGMAFALKENGQLRKAEKAYQEVLRINPNYRYANFGYGELLLKLGRPDEALNRFYDAVKNPQEWALGYDPDKLIESTAKKALKKDPADPVAKNILQALKEIEKQEKDKKTAKAYDWDD